MQACRNMQSLPASIVESYASKRRIDPRSVQMVRKDLRVTADGYPICSVTIYSSRGGCQYRVLFSNEGTPRPVGLASDGLFKSDCDD